MAFPCRDCYQTFSRYSGVSQYNEQQRFDLFGEKFYLQEGIMRKIKSKTSKFNKTQILTPYKRCIQNIKTVQID
jgi:virulence-associated protein VapD